MASLPPEDMLRTPVPDGALPQRAKRPGSLVDSVMWSWSRGSGVVGDTLLRSMNLKGVVVSVSAFGIHCSNVCCTSKLLIEASGYDLHGDGFAGAVEGLQEYIFSPHSSI